MGNVLRIDKRRVIESMNGLEWSDRRIEREAGVHRMTIAKYRKAFQNRPQVPAGFSVEKRQNDPQVPTGLSGSSAVEMGLSAEPETPLPPPRNPSSLRAGRAAD